MCGTGGHATISTSPPVKCNLRGMRSEASWAGRVEVAELSDRLSALRLMSEQARREIEASLKHYGQLSPVVCCRDDGDLLVVDGFKRLRAARTLGTSGGI